MGKIVALVPARAGSIRIKNKNIRQIKGIPLIGLAVKQAMEVPEIEEVYISTDSELYAEIAMNYGAKRPFIRPKNISGGRSTDYDVFDHFLKWYQDYYGDIPELIVQMRATAPVRKKEIISNAIWVMQEYPEFDSLRSISIPHQTPYKMWVLNEKYEIKPVISAIEDFYDRPTQELPKCYGQDGIVDIVRPRTLLQYKNMSGKRIAGILHHLQTWDIDTEADFIKAGELLKNYGIFRLLHRSEALGGNLGIVQGRLTESKLLQSFPKDWRGEFDKARKCGYSSIELFRDKEYNPENPLWKKRTDLEELKQVSFHEGVGIYSICDDYIQQCDWAHLSIKQYTMVEDLLLKASYLGASVVVFPMFERADIFKGNSKDDFLIYISQLGILAQTLNISIALEISESVEKLTDLFGQIKNSNVGLCVDTGNLYTKGINVSDVVTKSELQHRIIHVHLKDRDLTGENVVPGVGKVDFYSIFKRLFEIGYEGMLITETDRGENPLVTAVENKKFFMDVIKRI